MSESTLENNSVLGNLIATNKTALLAALREAGIGSVSLEYSGSGDSSDGWQISSVPDNANLTGLVRFSYCDYFYGDRAVKTDSRRLKDALVEFGEQLIDHHGHDGWENNCGGNGEIILSVEENCYLYTHNDCFEDYETSSYEG